jgi:iron complex outermembrane receptor protein
MSIRTVQFGHRAQLLARSALVLTLLAAPAAAYAQTTDSAAQTDVEEPTEVVITGSSIRGIPPTGSGLISVTREDAKLIGAASTPELLATVPQLNSFNTAPRVSNNGLGSFAPGLRGLPTAATLPLMNGHRLISGSTQQTNPDYPFIPELAIERVEIVADGASAIYGSEAVAGVVNFITRRRIKGVEAIVRYGIADDYNAFNAGLAFGHDWASGSFVAAYQYQDNSNITGADRSYRSLDFRAVGGIDTRSAVCPDANVNLFAGTIYAAPSLAPGLNTCDPRGPVDLLPQNRTHSAFASARQDLSDAVTLWADFLYSDRRDVVQAALPGQTFVLITAANPFFRAPPGAGSVFGYVDFRPDQAGRRRIISTRASACGAGNATAGVDVELPGDFKASVYGSFNLVAERHVPARASTPRRWRRRPPARRPRLRWTRSATGTSPAVRCGDPRQSDRPSTNRQRTRIGAVKSRRAAGGSAGRCELKVAVGAEYRRETYRSARIRAAGWASPRTSKRSVQSLYGELFVPIVGEGNATADACAASRCRCRGALTITTATSVRRANPKVGLTWEPVEGHEPAGQLWPVVPRAGAARSRVDGRVLLLRRRRWSMRSARATRRAGRRRSTRSCCSAATRRSDARNRADLVLRASTCGRRFAPEPERERRPSTTSIMTM